MDPQPANDEQDTLHKKSCNRQVKKLKAGIHKALPGNKHLPWQAMVPAWWKEHDVDLMAQVVIVHIAHSDTFDTYVTCKSSSRKSSCPLWIEACAVRWLSLTSMA